MGRIFSVKHFAVHDGNGIRTTVFFKGCPLRCVWCHNPEGLVFDKQTALYKDKCMACGECESICDCHIITNGDHFFDREKCTSCGRCTENCPNDALILYGRDVTVDELLHELLEDKIFYENSGGGVTLSGGECLMQADFCRELLEKLKKLNIGTAVDTSGHVKWENIEKVLPFTDTFLYDVKAYHSDVHKKCTGQDNTLILENLTKLVKSGADIEVRIPCVKDHNTYDLPYIAEMLKKLGITKVKLLRYHALSGNKYLSLGYENNIPDESHIPTDEEMSEYENMFR